MLNMFIKVYRGLFANSLFYRFNRLLYRCSLSGLGILNYESDRLSGEDWFIKKYLKGKDGVIIFDVGANVGKYSRKILNVCPRATIFAFEPHPKTFLVLSETVKEDNFIPVNAAVGEIDGVRSLFDYELDDGSSHASLYQDVIEGIHKKKSTEHVVSVISLGNFAKSKGVDCVYLLKIDVEGNELSVLKGMEEYIQHGKVKIIQFEFNEMNVSSRSYFRDFWELLPNYRFYRLLPSGMVEIKEYSPIVCEIFAYQNIVAILNTN